LTHGKKNGKSVVDDLKELRNRLEALNGEQHPAAAAGPSTTMFQGTRGASAHKEALAWLTTKYTW
jgi:hypothetical protein